MRAMLLAAGRGERMRPLTEHTPKPLLRVGPWPLLEHHIRRLAKAGVRELVINVSHLGQQIMDYCGEGAAWGVAIRYSVEDEPLETAGGILRALPHLGSAPFAVINGDIWMDYDVAALVERSLTLPPGGAALLLVDNPPHHPAGDFGLAGDKVVASGSGATLTFSGVGIYTPEFFRGVDEAVYPLRPLFDRAIAGGVLFGQRHPGLWTDVGTPERLRAANELFAGQC